MEFLLPGNCPASLPPTAAHLWKTFRSKLNAIPVDEQNCSPSHRNHVHLPTGMLFGITTERRSASDRNRVHLRPDSPVRPWTPFRPPEQIVCPLHVKTRQDRRHDPDYPLATLIHSGMVQLRFSF